jgi:hypothetical protein
MTKIEELKNAWREFVLHEREKAVESEAEALLRTSGDLDAWVETAFYKKDTAWRARDRELEKLIDALYSEAEIGERERALVEAGFNTTCCCNVKSAAYAWCSVTWSKDSILGSS